MLVMTGRPGEDVVIRHGKDVLRLRFLVAQERNRVRIGYDGPGCFVITRERTSNGKSSELDQGRSKAP